MQAFKFHVKRVWGFVTTPADTNLNGRRRRRRSRRERESWRFFSTYYPEPHWLPGSTFFNYRRDEEDVREFRCNESVIPPPPRPEWKSQLSPHGMRYRLARGRKLQNISRPQWNGFLQGLADFQEQSNEAPHFPLVGTAKSTSPSEGYSWLLLQRMLKGFKVLKWCCS